MVLRDTKNKATLFLCDLIDSSDGYQILKRDNLQIFFKENPSIYENPFQAQIIIPNFMHSVNDFKSQLESNSYKNIFTVPVFYKDGNSAFARMVEKNMSWRTNKSLKNYTPEEINQMTALRSIEKTVLRYMSSLQYYQPETEKLEESVREFGFKSVILDYSHILPQDRGYGYAKNGVSIDYKLPNEVQKIKDSAIITLKVAFPYISKLMPFPINNSN